MKTLLCLCLCVLLIGTCIAQANLVPNPSFEEIKTCHTSSGITDSPKNFPYIQHWFSPIQSSPDYFNLCSDPTFGYSVPQNKSGFQQPRNGSGYAGLILLFQISDYREYVSTRLTTPLVNGGIYKVTWYVSLADRSNNVISQIGCLFSPAIPADATSILNQRPQVQNDPNRFLNDSLSWSPISGFFKATGGEEYLTIGNFNKDQATLTSKSNSNLPNHAYYYIDDVSATFVMDGANKLIDTVICAGGEFTLSMRAGYDSCRWHDGDTSRSRSFTTPGTYWVHQYFDRNIVVTDTLRLSHFDTTSATTHLSFCNKPSFLLAAKPAPKYLWSNADTSATSRYYGGGRYWVKRSHNECSAVDTFEVTLFPLPDLHTLRDTVACFDEVNHIVLDGGTYVDYKWEPIAPNTSQLIVREGTQVTLTVTDSHACVNSKSILVKDSCSPYLFVPTAFTPNGDGLNDVFLPASRNLTEYELMIVNSWGAIVFQTRNPAEGWDGKNAVSGNYVVSINYKVPGNKPISMTQNLMLLR